VFIISGFWHGANWTFIIWGALNALFFLPLLLSKQNRTHLDTVAQGKLFPSMRELAAMTSTFLLTVMAWVFFRAESMSHAAGYFQYMFDWSLFTMPVLISKVSISTTLILLLIFVLIEWFGRESEYAIENIERLLNRFLRWCFYAIVIAAIIVFTPTEQNPFIYFQF
jgi:D-alanyl-lipoteichoic acid acyltransferase DltB (MBOAT superfamily)